MKKIGFIGAYNKTDLIIYTAKILVELGKKVIVIDSTVNQKAKYIVPAINPTTTYITDYEEIDIAVGFYSYEGLAQYLGLENFNDGEYDYALIDIDNPDMIDSFNIQEAETNFFVTAFDLYSLKRGIEILSGIKQTIELRKILFAEAIYKEDDEYLNFLSLDKKIIWDDEKVYFPIDINDRKTIIESQRISKVKFKTLTSEYKEALMYLVQVILKENNTSSIKKIFKQI